MRISLRCSSHWVLLGVLVFTGISLGQSKRTAWKEYSFPDDGFAISLPDAPRKHPDESIPDATAYSVNINADYAVTVRAKKDPRGECRAALTQLREGVLG